MIDTVYHRSQKKSVRLRSVDVSRDLRQVDLGSRSRSRDSVRRRASQVSHRTVGSSSAADAGPGHCHTPENSFTFTRAESEEEAVTVNDQQRNVWCTVRPQAVGQRKPAEQFSDLRFENFEHLNDSADERDREFKPPHLQCHGELENIPLREPAARAATVSLLVIRHDDALLAEMDEPVLRYGQRAGDTGDSEVLRYGSGGPTGH